MTDQSPSPAEGVKPEPWKPCALRDLTCDGTWHRGWDGHDPYLARCPRPRPAGETQAHKILGEFCACYAEAWPAETCATEAKKLADYLAAPVLPVDVAGVVERLTRLDGMYADLCSPPQSPLRQAITDAIALITSQAARIEGLEVEIEEVTRLWKGCSKHHGTVGLKLADATARAQAAEAQLSALSVLDSSLQPPACAPGIEPERASEQGEGG